MAMWIDVYSFLKSAVIALLSAFVFSIIVASVLANGNLLYLISGMFILFYSGTFPAILMSVCASESNSGETARRKYLSGYFVTLIVFIVPMTVIYRSVVGNSVLYRFDYFVGVVVYVFMGVIFVFSLHPDGRKS